MNPLKLINTINIEKPYNILPNEDSHIICQHDKLDINGYKIDIKSHVIRFSNEGYLYCYKHINKICKVDNFKIKDSYDIKYPYDILINNNEIIIDSNGKCRVYDSSLNEIKTLDIEYCMRMNMNNENDIFICDYDDNKVKVYSYNYEFKYNIDIKHPRAVAIINDTIFIIDWDNKLYYYTDKLEYVSTYSYVYFIQSEKDKLYVPDYYDNKIYVYELV